MLQGIQSRQAHLDVKDRQRGTDLIHISIQESTLGRESFVPLFMIRHSEASSLENFAPMCTIRHSEVSSLESCLPLFTICHTEVSSLESIVSLFTICQLERAHSPSAKVTSGERYTCSCRAYYSLDAHVACPYSFPSRKLSLAHTMIPVA